MMKQKACKTYGKIKRVICVLVVGAMLLGALSIFAACDDDPWDNKQEDQGFYYYVTEDKEAWLLGLVDSTIERDELIIPQTIGKENYPVVQIGHLKINSFSGRTTGGYGIAGDNIKIIVINHDITIKQYGIHDSFKGTMLYNYEMTAPDDWGSFIEFDFMGGGVSPIVCILIATVNCFTSQKTQSKKDILLTAGI